MQTPAGYTVKDGRFFPADWLAIVFNPSFPYRLAHNVVAFYVTTGFVVLGVGAYLVRRSNAPEETRQIVRITLSFLAIFVPLQIFLGDLHGLSTRAYQPAKLAAIEGRWDTARPAPLTLFGIPDQKAERNRFEVEIPVLGSLILTHSFGGEIRGLKDFSPDQRPPVRPMFFAFCLMVGIGLLMLGVVALGWLLRLRGRLCETVWFMQLRQWMAPLGFVAVLAGWCVAEVGREPWTIYGQLRTAKSVSPSLAGPDVLWSLVRQSPAAQAAPGHVVEGLQSRALIITAAE